MLTSDDDLFIFRDAGGKRWPRLRLVLLGATLLLFLGLVLFAQSLFITPQLRLPAAVQQLKAHLRGSRLPDNLARLAPTPKPLWRRFIKGDRLQPAVVAPTGAQASRPTDSGHDELKVRLGFYVAWDPNSYEALAAHAGQLTHVCPEWLTIIDGEGTIVAKTDDRVAELAKERKIVLLPLLSNLVGDAWQPEAVEGLAGGPKARQDRFIAALLEHLAQAEAGGVIIDWGQIDPAYRQQITNLLGRLAAALHEQDLQLWLGVPMGLELKAFDLDALAPVVDRFVAMLHDENAETDPPGPVASRQWFEGWLQTVTGYGKPAQWIIAIGNYGYDWAKGQKQAEQISFADAMTRANRAGLEGCRVEAPSYNPSFSYLEGDTEHTVWFLDAITFGNQAQAANRLRAGGIAISRLGTEDPALWQAMPLSQLTVPRSDSQPVSQPLLPDGMISDVGQGNFLTLDEKPSEGVRRIATDSFGQLIASYEKFPTYVTITHQGRGKDDEVAISFDDGPDPEWTPPILAILKARRVKAAFFMVGDRMEEHPELVERILREGHEIGVHTYTHPNLATVSEERARLELNATQRLIETITNRATFLFRPPYNADSQPHSPEELVPIRIAQELGYLTVASDIDPEDWGRPGVETIVSRVKEQRPGGNVILLHDAGGNRGQTVAALPRIIDYLEERGDRIVSLGQLLGVPGDALMPPLTKNQQPIRRLIYDSGFSVLHMVGEFSWAFMIVTTVLVALRTLVVALLAQLHLRRKSDNQAAAPPFLPPVSIVIAAFNEEKVISRTLAALLHSEYQNDLEILVVDDGSTDDTATLVADLASRDDRLRLLRQSNKGKALALRAGFAAATHEIIVTLDADTIFQPDTVGRLIQPLRDARVGAVSGHVKVGNLQTLVARCQSLEYTCGFNLDRRAYQQLHCITVVPGAASAWRRSAIVAAGGISNDTLAEDTDLTLSLHRIGLRISYVPEAVAWTEAPCTFATLAKQRVRWAFGTMQCLWKHRDMVGNPRFKALGLFSLPSIWIFQILLVAVGPAVDALLLASLFFGLGAALFPYLIAFLAMDLFLAALACAMEGEPLRRAWLILPMRLIYRPLLAWVIWKAMIRAAKGALVGWGKLERSATITFGN